MAMVITTAMARIQNLALVVAGVLLEATVANLSKFYLDQIKIFQKRENTIRLRWIIYK